MREIVPFNPTRVIRVDDADYEWLVALGPWRVNSLGYARNSKGLSMARAILELGVDDRRTADHIDRDPVNNQRANLRIATRAQNLVNRAKWGERALFIGVRPHRRKFQAYIGNGPTRLHLGSFATAEQAARARDAEAVKVYGEFASLNFAQAAP